jgi:hypothetical protein
VSPFLCFRSAAKHKTFELEPAKRYPPFADGLFVQLAHGGAVLSLRLALRSRPKHFRPRLFAQRSPRVADEGKVVHEAINNASLGA